jgi:hypothetical protein
VHVDDVGFIMMRRRPETAALIARETFRHVAPWDRTSVTPANAVQVHAEAERALRNCPHATWPWLPKAAALWQMGAREEAQAAEARVPR